MPDPSERLPISPVGWALIASLTLNAWFMARGCSGDHAPEPEPSADQVAQVDEGAPAGEEAAPSATPEPRDPLPEPVDSSVQLLDVPIRGNLAASLVAPMGDQADRMAATVNRLLMWNLDVSRDLRAEDRLRILFSQLDSGEYDIHYASYESQKFDVTLEAARYQAPGRRFASWYDANAVSVAFRVDDAPVPYYEQITALVGDGRNHSGLDFKGPVDTPVTSPRNAEVLRINWNTRYNGNCIELRYPDGALARFLHLNSIDESVTEGGRVTAGQQIAMSGNTGRSYAPHLHYEIRRADGQRVVDPIAYHGVHNETLEGEAKAGFDQTLAGYYQQLESLTPVSAPADPAEGG